MSGSLANGNGNAARRVVNVLVTAPWYGPEGIVGGVARQVQLVAEALAERGHVTVVSSRVRDKSFEKSEINGLPVYRMLLRDPPLRLTLVRQTAAFLLFFPYTVWRLRRIVKQERVDVVHLNYLASNQIYFAALHAFAGPPYVITVRGDDVVCFHERSWTERMAIRYIYRHAGRVLANSRGLAEQTRQVFGLADVGYIWNCARFDDAADESGATALAAGVPDGFVLALGGFRRQKGFDILIRAWAKLRHRTPNRHLLLIGEQPPPETVELMTSLGCADSIHCRSYAPREVALGLMRHAYCLVVPSRWEGMPNVMLEAGTMSCPVIGSAVGGVPEIILEGETGLIVPIEDDTALAVAIDRYLADTALRDRLAKAHHDRVRALFSSDALADSYTKIFEDIAGAV